MPDASTRLDPAIQLRARSLLAALDPLSEFSDALRFRAGIEEALERAGHADSRRPVCVVLLGGTGVGKSTLFNALIGKPEASPTSAAERGFTRVPHVAATPADRVWLEDLEDLRPEFLDIARPGLILIDSPDMDSGEKANRDCARRVMAEADIVVYVTSPDKRANFDISEEIRAWGVRKRWFFVLTRADLLAADCDSVREDFCKRINGLGFPAGAKTVFLVDGTAPARGNEEGAASGTDDLERLHGALFAAHTLEERRALREDVGLRELAHALRAEGPVRALHHTVERGRASLGKIRADIRRAYAALLLSPGRCLLLEAAWRQQIWSLAACRVRGPLALAVHLRARLAGMALAARISRTEQRGALRTGFRRIRALLGGIDAGPAFVSSADGRERRTLDGLEQDARRTAEDLGLNAVCASSRASADKPPAGDGVDAWVDAALAERAARGVSRCVRSLHVWMGNLLPLGVLGRDVARLSLAWVSGQWLPAEFYYAALAVFAVSLVPGYLLVSAAIARLADDAAAAVRDALDEIEVFNESAPLANPLRMLEDAAEKACTLDRVVSLSRAQRTLELDPGRFGDEPRSGPAL